ncbi:Uncharacterised protein [uncultured Blautia sp.]|nr:Uncharacterised protein [uncultured Blautia sp.]
MFVNDLLPAVAVQHHHKGVKPRDGAPHLEAVHQKHGDGQLVPSGPEEKQVL